MKFLKLLFLLICFTATSQKSVINLDYSVKYIIPSKKKSKVDTLTLSFDKNGQYLFTNDRFLAKDFGLDVFGSSANKDNSNLGLLYNSLTDKIILNFEFETDIMFMKMDVKTIAQNGGEINGFSENLELITSKGKSITLLNQEVKLFEVYPKGQKQEAVSIIVDTKRPVDNNKLLITFIHSMLNASDSSGSIKINIPKGLILGVFDKTGSNLFEAIEIKDTNKTIEFEHTFILKE